MIFISIISTLSITVTQDIKKNVSNNRDYCTDNPCKELDNWILLILMPQQSSSYHKVFWVCYIQSSLLRLGVIMANLTLQSVPTGDRPMNLCHLPPNYSTVH